MRRCDKTGKDDVTREIGERRSIILNKLSTFNKNRIFLLILFLNTRLRNIHDFPIRSNIAVIGNFYLFFFDLTGKDYLISTIDRAQTFSYSREIEIFIYLLKERERKKNNCLVIVYALHT